MASASQTALVVLLALMVADVIRFESGWAWAVLALAAQRTNEVMRRLTVITSVFLPLSWIAGIYGMNFRYMPELEWRLGYPFALGLMAATALAMLAYFRRKGWL